MQNRRNFELWVRGSVTRTLGVGQNAHICQTVRSLQYLMLTVIPGRGNQDVNAQIVSDRLYKD